MMDFKIYELKTEKLKAISHPHRLCIIKGLMENSCNVTKIQECMKLPQSTVSQHLARLKSAGIIEGMRNGLEVCYKVIDNDVMNIIKVMFSNQDKN